MAYRPLLIKLGTRARATRPGFGAVGTITRVIPERGMYWLESATGIYPVRVDEGTIEIERPSRLGY
jgi:hypothetical protein